jgi:hypothetical protein
MLIYSIKKWKCPEGIFVNNFTGHEAIINTLSLNSEGVLFSGADNGTLTMWDYKTGLPFQHLKDIPQPGSLDAEAVSHLDTIWRELIDRVYSRLHLIRLVRDLLRVVRTRRSKCTRSRVRKDEGVACRYYASGINVHLIASLTRLAGYRTCIEKARLNTN